MANFQENFAIFFKADTKQAGTSIDKLLGLFDKTTDKVKVLKAQMEKAGLEFDETGDSALDLAKNYDKLMQSMQTGTKVSLQEMTILSMTLTELGGKIGAINDEVNTTTEELQQKLANIKATVGDNIDAKGLEVLEDQIRASSIQIGMDADLLAEKVTDALSAGASQETVAEQITLAGKAARGTRGDIDTMVDLGNAVRNTFGEASGGIQKIYDLTSKTYQLGDITGQEIAQGFGFVGGTAKEAGLQIEDLFASIAVGSKKVRPEQLFTGLNGAISELNTTNSKAEKALQSLGYENLQVALQSKSFLEISQELNQSGQKMTDVFGREAARAMNAIGSSTEDTKDILNDFNNVVGATDQVFKDASNTNKFLREQQKALADEWRISIGETILPLNNKWLEVQNKLLETATKLPPAIQKVIGVSLSAGTALGKTASFAGEAGKNISGIAEASEVLKKLKLSGMFQSAATQAKALGMSMQTTVPILLAAVAAFVAIDQALKAWNRSLDKKNKALSVDINEGALKHEIKQYEDMLKILQRTNESLTDEQYKYLSLRYNKSIKELEEMDRASLTNMIKVQKIARENTLDREQQKIKDKKKLEEDAINAEIDAKKQAEADKAKVETDKASAIRLKKEKELDAIAKTTEKINDSVEAKEDERRLREIEKQRDLDLKKIEGDTEYASKALEINKNAEDAIYAEKKSQLDKRIAEEKNALAIKLNYYEQNFENLTNHEYSVYEALLAQKVAITNAHNQEIESIDIQHTDILMAIDQQYIDWKAEKAQEELENEQRLNDERLTKAQEYYNQFNAIAGESAQILGESIVSGENKLREAFKSVLLNSLDFIEQQINLAIVGSIAQNILTAGLSSGQMATAIGLKAVFSGLKTAIASFDDGGIPTSDGLAMVHKSDVILNPTNDNAMMDALTTRLADKINSRQQDVKLVINERELGRATVGAIRREDETLPKGRRMLK